MPNLLAVVFLASFIEGLIQFFAGDNESGIPRKWIRAVSIVLGILVAVVYKVSVLSMVGIQSGVPYADYVFTGIIIGRGSNYVNDVFGFFRKNG